MSSRWHRPALVAEEIPEPGLGERLAGIGGELRRIPVARPDGCWNGAGCETSHRPGGAHRRLVIELRRTAANRQGDSASRSVLLSWMRSSRIGIREVLSICKETDAVRDVPVAGGLACIARSMSGTSGSQRRGNLNHRPQHCQEHEHQAETGRGYSGRTRSRWHKAEQQDHQADCEGPPSVADDPRHAPRSSHGSALIHRAGAKA